LLNIFVIYQIMQVDSAWFSWHYSGLFVISLTYKNGLVLYLYGLKMLKLEQIVHCLYLAGYYVTGNEGMFNPIFLYPCTIYKLDAEHCLGLA
jgi:hypothetical protein